MKSLINREGAKTAKKEEKMEMIGLNQKDFGVLRDLRAFAVKEVLV